MVGSFGIFVLGSCGSHLKSLPTNQTEQTLWATDWTRMGTDKDQKIKTVQKKAKLLVFNRVHPSPSVAQYVFLGFAQLT